MYSDGKDVTGNQTFKKETITAGLGVNYKI